MTGAMAYHCWPFLFLHRPRLTASTSHALCTALDSLPDGELFSGLPFPVPFLGYRSPSLLTSFMNSCFNARLILLTRRPTLSCSPFSSSSAPPLGTLLHHQYSLLVRIYKDITTLLSHNQVVWPICIHKDKTILRVIQNYLSIILVSNIYMCLTFVMYHVI